MCKKKGKYIRFIQINSVVHGRRSDTFAAFERHLKKKEIADTQCFTIYTVDRGYDYVCESSGIAREFVRNVKKILEHVQKNRK